MLAPRKFGLAFDDEAHRIARCVAVDAAEGVARHAALFSFGRVAAACLHHGGDFGAARAGERIARRAHTLAAAAHDLFGEFDRLNEIVLGIQMQERHEPAIDRERRFEIVALVQRRRAQAIPSGTHW